MLRACLGLAVALATVSLTGGPVGSETIVEARQRLMVSIVRATKIPRAMAKGEAALDEAAVKEAVKQVLEATSVLPRLFPNGSIDATSAALPGIFENRADFEARFLELEKTAVMLALAAKSGGDSFTFAFDEYQATCDGCHAAYRKPE